MIFLFINCSWIEKIVYECKHVVKYMKWLGMIYYATVFDACVSVCLAIFNIEYILGPYLPDQFIETFI